MTPEERIARAVRVEAGSARQQRQDMHEVIANQRIELHRLAKARASDQCYIVGLGALLDRLLASRRRLGLRMAEAWLQSDVIRLAHVRDFDRSMSGDDWLPRFERQLTRNRERLARVRRLLAELGARPKILVPESEIGE